MIMSNFLHTHRKKIIFTTFKKTRRKSENRKVNEYNKAEIAFVIFSCLCKHISLKHNN